jgi:hypothetical protein
MDGASISSASAEHEGGYDAKISAHMMEEIQVTTGGGDITNITGGPQVNFVSRRGGNRYSGEMYFLLVDKKFEMTYDLPQSMSQYPGPAGLDKVNEYGLSFGGPLVKNHLWFFLTAAHEQRDVRGLSGSIDQIYTPIYYGKFNAQWKFLNAELSYQYNYGGWKNGPWPGPGSAYQSPLKLNLDQINNLYTAKLSAILKNFIISAKYTLTDYLQDRYVLGGYYTGGGTNYLDGRTLNPPYKAYTYHNDLYRARGSYYYYNMNTYGTSAWQSYYQNIRRPYVDFTAEYFVENFLGGEHQFILGYDNENGRAYQEIMYANQRFFYYNFLDAAYGEYDYFRIVGDPYVNTYNSLRSGIYFQDTATYGRFTFNLGLRYDMQYWKWDEITKYGYNPGEGYVPAAWKPYLEEYTVPEGKTENINVFSPRLSISYDLTGDGRNVIKASLARYGGILANQWLSASNLIPGSGMRGFQVPFFDADNDGFPDTGEYLEPTPEGINTIRDEKTLPLWNVYTYTPASVGSSTTVMDPDFKPRQVDEAIFGYERELTTDFSASLLFTYKKQYNNMRKINYWGTKDNYVLEDASNYYEDTSLGKDPVTGQGIWRQSKTGFGGIYLTNSKGYTRMIGGQLILKKRLSNRWMADLSIDYGDWINHTDEGEIWVPTNAFYFQDTIASVTLYSTTEPPTNSRWQVKFSGLYQLPWGFSFSGVLQAREGFPVQEYASIYKSTYFFMPGTKFGDRKMPTYWFLNLALEKQFDLGERTKVILSANAYNITNNRMTTLVNQNAVPQTLASTDVMKPGIFQLGFRVRF